jgi:hypothetical protein
VVSWEMLGTLAYRQVTGAAWRSGNWVRPWTTAVTI